MHQAVVRVLCQRAAFRTKLIPLRYRLVVVHYGDNLSRGSKNLSIKFKSHHGGCRNQAL